METLAQLFTRIAQKAGVPADDPNLVNVLSSAELSKISVHPELFASLDNSLLSITQASDNHPTIKSAYTAKALNGIDTRLTTAMQAAGLSDEQIADLAAEKSTYTRLEKVLAAVKDAATNAAVAAHKGKTTEDKSALQRQVDELLAQIQTIKTGHEAKVAELVAAQENARIAAEVRGLLANTKTIFDEMAPGVKTAAIDSLIQKALQERTASFAFDETGAFILRGKDDAAVIAPNNVRYTPQTFVEEILSANKVLKVADPQATTTPKPQAQANGQTPNYQRQVQAGQPGNNAAAIADRNRASREAFERATAPN